MQHLVIIGNGISGITTARHVRKLSDKKITVISAESDYFFSRTALMYIYMGHMNYEHTKPYEDGFWKKNQIELLKGYVEAIHTNKKTVQLAAGSSIAYDQLVIATGSVTHSPGWEGEVLSGVQGLVSLQDLELLEKNTNTINHAVIVGGGLIGVELAEMLHTRKIEVTILVREKAFGASMFPIEEAEFISKHIESHGINILRKTELEEIIGDDNQRVKSVKTKDGKEIACQLVGIATGVKPTISFLKDSDIETDRGILVDRDLETNIPGIYAIGDCAQQRNPIGKRKPVEAVWYTGRMMGEALAQTLCGKLTKYNPGNWFNSAKFFDIEYQTYGWVWPEAKEGEADFYWEDSSGKKALHFNFDRCTEKLLGINSFGIRLRHEIIDRWLTEEKSISAVIAEFAGANFDKEFSRRYERHIREKFLQTRETSSQSLSSSSNLKIQKDG